MFTTEFVHQVQQLFGEGWYSFFEGISIFGNLLITTILIYVIIEAVDFKKGVLIANLFLFTTVVTFFLKEVIDYPRPLNVDPSLNSFDFEVGNDLTEIQPTGFFQLFYSELLDEVRKTEVPRQGLPSGHTSMIVALLFGSYLVFRKRWIAALFPVIIFLMMLSRVYLARHYLGDVIGGLIVGIVVVIVTYSLYSQLSSRRPVIFYLFPLILLLPIDYISKLHAGMLIGINLSYLLIDRKLGMLHYFTVGRRALSVFIIIVLAFIGIFLETRFLSDFAGPIPIILFSAVTFLTLFAGIYLALKLNLIGVKATK